ncbi:MAG: hypothetical protein ACKVX7_20150 [Planctomycetota bacterium]
MSVANLATACVCVYFLQFAVFGLIFFPLAFLGPIALGFFLACMRSPVDFVAAPLGACFLICAPPITMLIHPWPLLIAFFVSAPALERLADEAVAGQPVVEPRWAGLFRIEQSQVDPKTQSVALITFDAPGGDSGLVRFTSVARENYNHPLINLNFDIPLVRNWRYQSED